MMRRGESFHDTDPARARLLVRIGSDVSLSISVRNAVTFREGGRPKGKKREVEIRDRNGERRPGKN